MGRELRGLRSKRFRRDKGFTLIEMIIAIGITGLIATLAFGFFDSATSAKESSDEALQQINDLEAVFQLLATDLHHVVDRQLPSAAAGVGSTQAAPAFMGGDSSHRSANYLLGDYVLRFVRDGWANPLQQQRSDLQRVAYRWYDGELWRDFWPERNQPMDTEPAGRRLMVEGLEGIQIRFLPQGAQQVVGGPWQEVWPPDQTQTGQPATPDQGSLPVAVEITLRFEEVGDVQRIISLPGL